MLALLGAMREEIAGLRRHVAFEEDSFEQGCRIYRGEHENREVMLVETGIGKRRAERAAELVLERYPITSLVSLGFGGALTEEAKAGDVVLCSTLHEEGAESPCHSDANLISLAAQAVESAEVRLLQGSSVTAASVVSEPTAKEALGTRFSAKVVDMESYWIGRIASAKQVPFLAVRAISDALADSLPPFGLFLDSNGNWRRKRAALYFLFRPHQLMKLYCYYRNARKAERNLSRFVVCLIPRLQESKR